eukprot:2497260-Rhodomonas_salina.1
MPFCVSTVVPVLPFLVPFHSYVLKPDAGTQIPGLYAPSRKQPTGARRCMAKSNKNININSFA